MSAQAELDRMPEPGVLRRLVCEGRCVVSVGRSVVYDFDVTDIGMRNLAIVALTDAGRSVTEVAAVFGLTPTYVSMLRGRARQYGSAGLVRRRGRPRKLSERQVARARRWSGEGRSQAWIAERFGVARSVVSRLLAEAGPSVVQVELDSDTTEPVDAARSTSAGRSTTSTPASPSPWTDPTAPASPAPSNC